MKLEFILKLLDKRYYCKRYFFKSREIVWEIKLTYGNNEENIAIVIIGNTHIKRSDVSHGFYFESQSVPEIDIVPRREKAFIYFKG